MYGVIPRPHLTGMQVTDAGRSYNSRDVDVIPPRSVTISIIRNSFGPLVTSGIDFLTTWGLKIHGLSDSYELSYELVNEVPAYSIHTVIVN